jgi:hypothetical protein
VNGIGISSRFFGSVIAFSILMPQSFSVHISEGIVFRCVDIYPKGTLVC